MSGVLLDLIRMKRKALDDLDADIRDHLEREMADNIDRGMTPDDARAAALKRFGSIALAKEDTRAVWIPVWFDQLMQDVRYGLRMIRRTPAFSAVVMLTLALGIGLTTAVFSVVNAVLVRPLSYPNADRLVWIATPEERSNEELVMSPDLMAWRDQAQSLDRLAGFFIGGERIDVGDEVVQARVVAATDGFWDLAGARPALGTVPRPGEQGIVLSHAFFERWFRGDPGVVGRAVPLNGRPTAVTGVLPPGFRVQLPPPPAWSGVQSGEVDFYRASIIQPPGPPGPATAVQLFEVIGRLKPGLSLARAHDELDAIRANTEKAFGAQFRPRRLRIVLLADKIVGGARRSLIVLLAAVVLVLLIACANVANLLLARGSTRQREVAIRTAVGAGRSRMLRQFLVESLMLAAIGGTAGVLVARLALRPRACAPRSRTASRRNDDGRARARVRRGRFRRDGYRLRSGARVHGSEDQRSRRVEGRRADGIGVRWKPARAEDARRRGARAQRRAARRRRSDAAQLLAHHRESRRFCARACVNDADAVLGAAVSRKHEPDCVRR